MTTSISKQSQLKDFDKSIALEDKSVASLMNEFNASVTKYSRLAQQLHGKLSQYGWTKKESTELLNSHVKQVYTKRQPTLTYRGIAYHSSEQ